MSAGASPPRRFTLEGLTRDKLLEIGNRCHVTLDGRFVTVLLHKDNLFALDSPCYHASGPLGEGPVSDIEDIPCISCPWHHFLVALDTGEAVTRDTAVPDFSDGGVFEAPTYPMEPLPESMFVGKPKRGKVVQRVHKVYTEEGSGDVVVEIDADDVIKQRPLPSDTSACHPTRGAMSMQIRDIKARGLS